MRVSIKTKAFDGDEPGSWSRGKPEYTFGEIVDFLDKGRVAVWWKGDKKVNPEMNPLLKQLRHAPKKTSIASVMMALEVGSVPSFRPTDQDGAWPKNFLEALIRSDWRDWVMSVRKENNGGEDNDTTTEIPWGEMEQGALVIPLRELFTRKRDNTPKFRLYAMENLLKAGKDYGDTFSTCVSGDGIRWFV